MMITQINKHIHMTRKKQSAYENVKGLNNLEMVLIQTYPASKLFIVAGFSLIKFLAF